MRYKREFRKGQIRFDMYVTIKENIPNYEYTYVLINKGKELCGDVLIYSDIFTELRYKDQYLRDKLEFKEVTDKVQLESARAYFKFKCDTWVYSNLWKTGMGYKGLEPGPEPGPGEEPEPGPGEEPEEEPEEVPDGNFISVNILPAMLRVTVTRTPIIIQISNTNPYHLPTPEFELRAAGLRPIFGLTYNNTITDNGVYISVPLPQLPPFGKTTLTLTAMGSAIGYYEFITVPLEVLLIYDDKLNKNRIPVIQFFKTLF